MADTQSIIMVTVLVTTGSTLLAEQQTSTLTFKPIIGGWVLGLMLFIVAMFADDLARAFAILVMVTAVLVNGAKVFEAVNKATGETTAKANVTLGANGVPLNKIPNVFAR